MFSRIRVAAGLALMLALFASSTVFAKGSFAFIRVTGRDLKDVVRISDPTVTADYFAFANFFKALAKAPDNPGAGYEITRYYVDGNQESAFDKLHYYPDTGFVYYDGLVNGSSEYDGKWYTANADIKPIFEPALTNQIRLIGLGSEDAAKMLVPPPQPQASPSFAKPELSISIAVMAGLVMMLGFLVWRRRSSVR
ncbi:MAG: hypothetical protein ABI904_20540 [Chloroflexota bacterium]